MWKRGEMKMQYEEVYLEERIVVGVSTRIKNSNPTMPNVIGKLWKDFYSNNVYNAILDKASTTTIGLYDEYESDVNGAYDITVCAQVNKVEEIPKGCVVKHIPAGKYAKFYVHGHVQKAVMQFWQQLWKMDLKRSYKADFEEYMNLSEEEADIIIYIAL